jgi:excisionase family DNA binding protein
MAHALIHNVVLEQPGGPVVANKIPAHVSIVSFGLDWNSNPTIRDFQSEALKDDSFSDRLGRMANQQGEWIGLSEAARLLGVHPSTARSWADSGKLSVHRTAGGHRRFLRSEIEGYQRGPKASGAQFVIENVIGRTRLEVAEGRLENQAWYRRLTEPQREAYREKAHRLLQQVGELIGAETAEEPHKIGREYARISLDAGMTLVEAVQAFLFFRGFLMESIYSLQESQSGPAWTQFQSQAADFTDAVLVSLVEAYERP